MAHARQKSEDLDLFIPVVWSPLYSTLAAAAASMAVTAYVLQNNEPIIDRVHDGVFREAARILAAFGSLSDHILTNYTILGLVVRLLFWSLVTIVVVYGYLNLQRILHDAIQRSSDRKRKDTSHATDFKHEHNAQLNTKFANTPELLILTTLAYLVDASNLVTLGVILLQGIGSNWTKHKMNMWMYISFFVWTLVTELQSHFSKRFMDDAVNTERYWCALLGTKIRHDVSTLGEAGFVCVEAKRIGLGNIVMVNPGCRVPIDGFIVQDPRNTGRPTPQAPFNYAITGENTVMNPPLSGIPVPFHDIVDMEYKEVPVSVEPSAPIRHTTAEQADTPIQPTPLVKSASADHVGIREHLLDSSSVTSAKRSILLEEAASPVLQQRTGATSHQLPANLGQTPIATGCTPVPIGKMPVSIVSLKRWWASFKPKLSVVAPAPLQATANTGAQFGFRYHINGEPISSHTKQVHRGVVHAPNDARTPLFVLAGIPYRLDTSSTRACHPAESQWRWVVKRVMIIQIMVLLLFSIQGWATGQHMTQQDVTVGTFISFLLGQMVLGNTLLPLRESVVNALFLGVAKALFPGVTVKVNAALEELRLVKNVVSDKTGTLTVEAMSYQKPLYNPSYVDHWDIGDLVLLATNDSQPNPYHNTAVQPMDPRLAQAECLCTTAEEGAIFTSLFSSGRYEWVSKSNHGASPPWVCIRDRAAARYFRLVWHYMGGFEPTQVARFSVVSVYSIDDVEGSNVVIDGTPIGECRDWQEWCNPLLIVQGGGDSVASFCGAEFAEWEQSELRRDPRRTLGHAVCEFSSCEPLFDRDGTPRSLTRSKVLQLHEKTLVKTRASGALSSKDTYQLAAVSKFDNPLVAGCRNLVTNLQIQGVRLHVCTGDTYLTLKAVMAEMDLLQQKGCTTILWDDQAFPTLPKLMTAVFDASVALPAVDVDPFYKVLEDANAYRRVIILCNTTMLEILHANRHHPIVQKLMGLQNVHFGFYRIKQVVKPLAVALFAESDEVPPVFMGDGPNDSSALASTPHSFAMNVGASSAKNAANFELAGSSVLPDALTLARLLHGGKAIIFRDIVFVGSFIVVLLSFAAHISSFRTIGRHVRVLEDPWNPWLMTLFTMVVHTPRMLVLAVTEGLHSEWVDHRDLVFKTTLEAIFGLLSSLWVGIWLKGAVENPDGTINEDESLAMFAPLALASLAVITYLRQNLVVSRKLLSVPRVLPPATNNVGTHLYRSPGTKAVPPVEVTQLRVIMAYVVWFFNGFFGQSIILALYLRSISSKDADVLACLSDVGKAVFGPALLMAVFRLAVVLSRESDTVELPQAVIRDGDKAHAIKLRYGV